MIFFPFFPLAHLALQNVNKDYIIFLFFATLLPKVTKKDKQKMGWLGTARALKDQDRIEKERYTMSVTSVMYSGPSEIKLQRGFTKGIGAFPSPNLLHSSLTCQLAFSTHTNFLIFDRILINCRISTYFFHLKINGYCRPSKKVKKEKWYFVIKIVLIYCEKKLF